MVVDPGEKGEFVAQIDHHHPGTRHDTHARPEHNIIAEFRRDRAVGQVAQGLGDGAPMASAGKNSLRVNSS